MCTHASSQQASEQASKQARKQASKPRKQAKPSKQASKQATEAPSQASTNKLAGEMSSGFGRSGSKTRLGLSYWTIDRTCPGFKRIMHGVQTIMPLLFNQIMPTARVILKPQKTADLFRKRRAQSSNHTCSEIIHAQPQRQTAERKSKAQSTTTKALEQLRATTSKVPLPVALLRDVQRIWRRCIWWQHLHRTIGFLHPEMTLRKMSDVVEEVQAKIE